MTTISPNFKTIFMWSVLTLVNVSVGVGATTVLFANGLLDSLNSATFFALTNRVEKEHRMINTKIDVVVISVEKLSQRIDKLEAPHSHSTVGNQP